MAIKKSKKPENSWWTHFFDVLKALDLYDPEAWHMQLACPIRVDFDVQLLSIFTQKVPEIGRRIY